MAVLKKIIIVDDHQLFRESTKQVVEQVEGFEVVGTAADAREGEKIAGSLKPDLAIVDLSLPDKSGIQLTRTLTTVLPDLRVVIVSMHSKIDYIVSALRAGALGYVVKESLSRCLVESLESSLEGKYYLDPTLSQEIATKLLDFDGQQGSTDSSYGALSPREQEVLRFLAQGVTNKEIAEKLFISAKTVANHRSNIMMKLDLHSTAELIRYAAQLGLLGGF